MAPQQRIALKLAWTAIEEAGYKAGFFKASKTGVFF
jgi:polyketide synthase PksL